MRSIAVAALPLLAAVACRAPEPIPVSDVRAGITLRGGDQATPDDHLVELLVHEGHVYVANSNSASDTLYCGSDEPFFAVEPTLVLFDVSTPGQPVQRERFELIELIEQSTRDLEVIGDRLLVHQFHGGLWTAAIGSDGTLTQLADTGIEGNARVSTAVGDRVVTLFGDVEGTGAELRLLDPADWSELDRLTLAGPPLGLSADAHGASRVAVGLGSGGMAVVDLVGDELLLARLLEPPAVVTQGLIDGELAAAVTLSGVFAWSLPEQAEQPARLFGFGPAAQLDHRRAGNMLHGLFVDGEILTSDWLHVERWVLDPSGEVSCPSRCDSDTSRPTSPRPRWSCAATTSRSRAQGSRCRAPRSRWSSATPAHRSHLRPASGFRRCRSRITISSRPTRFRRRAAVRRSGCGPTARGSGHSSRTSPGSPAKASTSAGASRSCWPSTTCRASTSPSSGAGRRSLRRLGPGRAGRGLGRQLDLRRRHLRRVVLHPRDAR